MVPDEPFPVVHEDQTPAELGETWGAAPIHALRTRDRNERIRIWVIRVGGFLGLALLLDFLLTHI